ncbi:aldolase/citrate lyase family protein [Rhodoferax sp.]|uniref:HpcH/HpaI aldolase/citrate lyase family protein n=1 Tax=Rhodoferax sp. TaxID=50421 RepID=UPI00284CEC3E|nr:aldolase/citrate lyase family protein [Rhodoferax sp.]MDR3370594.1 aldolase/citrate lyase family protein [Rhodoferax sp.]
MIHPRHVLLGAAIAVPLPVCDHYCGVESRMVKALALQEEMMQEFGACVFDVTLDCEDGAPVGGERDHALMVSSLVNKGIIATDTRANGGSRRVAVRVHPVDHPAFEQDLEIVLGHAACVWSHVMVPKVDSVADVDRAVQVMDAALASSTRDRPLSLHVLIESPLAVHQVASIAAHPRVESLSFGLMDFVSAHGGAIPASAMAIAGQDTADGHDQFSHPLVVRAKLEISAACHAFGKVPSHCVVTEFKRSEVVQEAARRASRDLGYMRMWSIHPDQIRPILSAFTPAQNEVDQASHIICRGYAAQWAPISVAGKLQDRASYRYYWQVLERAFQTAHLSRQDPAYQYFVL